MGKMFDLSKEQADQLKELGSMGAGNAATAMSSLIGKETKLNVPSIEIVPFENIPCLVGGEHELISGVFLQLFGEIPGSVLLLFKRGDALKLVDMMTGKKVGTTKILSDWNLDIFMEMGNILSSSYLSALANFFETKFVPSVPSVVFNLAGMLVEFVKYSSNEEISDAVLISTDFQVAGKDAINGVFVLLLGSKSFKDMMGRLKSKSSLVKKKK